MEKIWFIYANEIVSGPFSTDQVKSDLDKGRWNANTTQIWWKGQKEWTYLQSWITNLDQILEGNKAQEQQAVWYAEQHGAQKGPLTKSQLVDFLKGLDDVKSVRLWTVGLNHWSNLFEFHEIISNLGMSKRTFERAPIVGHVSINKNGEIINKTLASVSGGGLGMKHCEDLLPGDILSLAIHSPLLTSPVRATAKVMYIEPNGYAGVQFQSIHIESKTTLMDYVRQFRTESGSNVPSEKTVIRRVS